MTNDFYRRTETFIQGSTTLPQPFFTDPEVYEQELERIFFGRWICAGRSEQVPTPGNYFLLNLGSESVILVRNHQDTVNAYYNVCRHRGTRICVDPKGQYAETIQCPYHAWTYSLDGHLVGAPFMAEVEQFDRANYSLYPIHVSEWEGFLFINLSPDPEPFERAFAPLIGRFSRFNLMNLQAAHQIEYDVQANWKLIIQNYSECLHCPTLHPGLARLSPFQSGKNDLVDGLFLGGYMEMVDTAGSLTTSGRACGVPVGSLQAEDLKRVYYYTVFPNLLLSLHPDYVMVHWLWPQSPDHTRITCSWMFHPTSFNQPGFDPFDAIQFWDVTNRQDWEICERSQAGVKSRAYRPGPYSARESLLAAWDREYLRVLTSDKTP